MKLGSAPVRVPRLVLVGIEAVRRSGLTNMLDRSVVTELAESLGHSAAGAWVDGHRAEYATGIFNGFVAEEESEGD